MMKNAIALSLLVVLAAGAKAGTLFYGGDFDGRNGLSSERNTDVADAMTFENFRVDEGGWRVQSVFGHFLSDIAAPANLEWEIRRGVSTHNAGTVVVAGQNTLALWDATGREGFGYLEFRAEAEVDFELEGGDYWLGIAVIGEGSGRAFLTTTSGENATGGPVADGNSFFRSDYFGANFDDAGWYVGDNADFSVGLGGEPVPEPASIVALGLGLAAMRRRRSRA
jgi:hypothetical protein